MYISDSRTIPTSTNQLQPTGYKPPFTDLQATSHHGNLHNFYKQWNLEQVFKVIATFATLTVGFVVAFVTTCIPLVLVAAAAPAILPASESAADRPGGGGERGVHVKLGAERETERGGGGRAGRRGGVGDTGARDSW